MSLQGSPEWFAERCGRVTASRISDIIATTKSGPSASRKNYLAQIVAERLTGTVEPGYTSGPMQWGIETEPLARASYEVMMGIMVDQVGFVPHPEIAFSGASPDGLVGDAGLIEIKAPNTATHIEYILAGVAPKKYRPQMGWQLACTGRKWCDFVSYDPRMSDDLQLFVVRFEPTLDEILMLEGAVVEFLGEVQATIDGLLGLKVRKENKS
jgi:putative phage-type endonuclease